MALDHAHVWHPFTPMRQWRAEPPLIIERAEGDYLIDTAGLRYIDGVSSLWCNVHGHGVPEIDRAIRDQLDNVAHTTLLGLASPPSIRLAAELARRSPGALNKVFYSDAGATALEVAFKMAVGYWHHRGRPEKSKFIGLAGAYHGDTTGSMSVGFSDLFHKPFVSMVFDVTTFPNVDAARSPRIQSVGFWPCENEALNTDLLRQSFDELARLLEQQGSETAAIVIEPVMQGAAGMICQPPGFVRGVADLARRHDVLLIADEVATGFGRTGTMFAVEHDGVEPDILCLAKGLSAGYLPLAATLCTDDIEQAFCGELDERKTLYHGHTYTGNALACAAALASLELFDQNRLLDHVNANADLIRDRLNALRGHPHILDIRQRGIMVGIELRDPDPQPARELCTAMRPKGLIIRPLGNVLILMPIPAMARDTLDRMLDIVVETLLTGN